MRKKYILALILAIATTTILSGCKKQHKAQWREYGVEENKETVSFGIHPERGTDSNAVPVFTAIIFSPTGLDSNGKSTYKRYTYEMDELTPENIDLALKDYGVIAEDCLFVDLEITDSYLEPQSAGPGAPGEMLTKEGNVRYVDMPAGQGPEVYSNITNDGDYEEGQDTTGKIDMDEVIKAVCLTYQENYQLLTCSWQAANMTDYYNAHPDKKPTETTSAKK